MTEISIRELLATIAERVEGLGEKLDDTRQYMQASEKKSDESRGHMHKRLDGVKDEIHELKLKTSNQETALEGLKAAVIEVQAVTDDVKSMRQQALGAGTLGRGLLWIGGGVLTIANLAAAAYTWVFGRPPP